MYTSRWVSHFLRRHVKIKSVARLYHRRHHLCKANSKLQNDLSIVYVKKAHSTDQGSFLWPIWVVSCGRIPHHLSQQTTESRTDIFSKYTRTCADMVLSSKNSGKKTPNRSWERSGSAEPNRGKYRKEEPAGDGMNGPFKACVDRGFAYFTVRTR